MKAGNGLAAVREDETSINQCSSQVRSSEKRNVGSAKAGVKGLEVD